MRVRTLSPGELTKFQLKNGTSFSLYWKYQRHAGDIRSVVVVLRRHCSGQSCAQLCDCADQLEQTELGSSLRFTRSNPKEFATLELTVVPYAMVSWSGGQKEATGVRPLLLKGLFAGDYEMRFEHPAFDPVVRTVTVKPGENSYEIDLFKEAPTRTKLR